MYHQNTDKEKTKPMTYEQIRDIVLDKKEDVKEMIKNKKKVKMVDQPIKKVHNFEFV
jgi:hypothetical protein